MPTASLIRCPQCQAVARTDKLQVSNPVQLGSNPRAPQRPVEITRCEGCEGFYWIEEAEVVAELELRRAGAALADVVLLDAGDNLAAVLTALNHTDRWASRAEQDSLPELPWTIVADVALETADGLLAAWTELGAKVEVRPQERHPEWDSAPRVRQLIDDEWDAAIDAGCAMDPQRLEYLKRHGDI